jgi:hypothetical protein
MEDNTKVRTKCNTDKTEEIQYGMIIVRKRNEPYSIKQFIKISTQTPPTILHYVLPIQGHSSCTQEIVIGR